MARNYNVGAVNRGQQKPSAEAKPSSGPAVVDRDDDSDVDPLIAAVAGNTAEEIVQAQEDAAASVGQLPNYPLHEIAPHPFNPAARLDLDDELIDLGENIKAEGLHQPIVLAPRELIQRDDPAAARLLADQHRWVLIAGHRRYAASQHAEVPELPGLQRLGSCAPAAIAAIFSDENLRRKAPSPLMLAQMWNRMREADMSTTEIARRVGFSQPQVSKTLKLLALENHPEVASEMNAGRLTRDDAFAWLDASEDEREPAFIAWRAEAGTESAKPLRAYLLRVQSSTESAAAPTSKPRRDKTEPAAEPTHDYVWTEPIASSSVAAILKAGVSATVRADMLADVALHIDEGAAEIPEWRPLAAEILGIDVPNGELDTSSLSQSNRRKLATIRALVILDAELGHHVDRQTKPPHVLRHIQRLRDLGAAG